MNQQYFKPHLTKSNELGLGMFMSILLFIAIVLFKFIPAKHGFMITTSIGL